VTNQPRLAINCSNSRLGRNS